MKFLIDANRKTVIHRYQQWPDGVAGQLLTPLTRYKRCADVFAIDNGCYGGLKESAFISLLKREYEHRQKCLFVCIPDKVGCHMSTSSMWVRYQHLADGYKRAFVAQDGFNGIPEGADALFIGGTNVFKESREVLQIVSYFASRMHVHIGRVNTHRRFRKFRDAGAHTCDGSGICRFSEMLPILRAGMGE